MILEKYLAIWFVSYFINFLNIILFKFLTNLEILFFFILIFFLNYKKNFLFRFYVNLVQFFQKENQKFAKIIKNNGSFWIKIMCILWFKLELLIYLFKKNFKLYERFKNKLIDWYLFISRLFKNDEKNCIRIWFFCFNIGCLNLFY